MKFKVWKYRNVFTNSPPNKDTIQGIDVCSSFPNTFPGSLIRSNRDFIAYVSSKNVQSLQIIPISFSGRNPESLFSVNTANQLTDFDFNPCNPQQVIVSSSEKISLHDITSSSSPVATVPKSATFIRPNTYVDGLVFCASTTKSFLCDFTSGHEIELPEFDSPYSDGGWNVDFGCNNLILTSKKGAGVLIDARSPSLTSFDLNYRPGVHSALWFSENFVITSGSSKKSQTREANIFDVRNTDQPLSSTKLSHGTNCFRFLYDPDTAMVFSYARGENSILFSQLERTDPVYSVVSTFALQDQVKDIALTPKTAVDAIKFEINRLNVLTNNSVIPLPYKLPLKGEGEFREEYFPDTCAAEPCQTFAEWQSCQEIAERPKISLRPAENVEEEEITEDKTDEKAEDFAEKPTPEAPKEKTSFVSKIVDPCVYPKYTSVIRIDNATVNIGPHSSSFVVSATADDKRPQFFAVPITSCSTVHVRILPLKLSGRADVHPFKNVIKASVDASEMAVDPHSGDLLAVGYADSTIVFWRVSADLKTSESVGAVDHQTGSRITILLYNSYARGILASSDCSGTVAVWNTETFELLSRFKLGDQCAALAWSHCGYRLCCLDDGGRLGVYGWGGDSMELVHQTSVKDAQRWGRCCWSGDDRFIIVSTFSKRTYQRILALISVKNNLKEQCRIHVGSGASPMCAFYDVDTNFIILTAKGELTTNFAFLQYKNENEAVLELLKGSQVPEEYQQMYFLPKIFCNVKAVEFAAGYMFSGSKIEKISFKMKRYRPEYFQDDVFPPTAVLWEPTVTSGEWVRRVRKDPRKVSLAPPGMIPLSAAPEIVRTRKYVSFRGEEEADDGCTLKSIFDNLRPDSEDEQPRHLDDDDDW